MSAPISAMTRSASDWPIPAIGRELREETGYGLGQLRVLQPELRLTSLTGDDLHPQPACVRSFPFGVGTGHFHTDLTYAFVTGELPRYAVGAGESHDFAWLTRQGLADLASDETYEDVRQVGLYVLDRLLAAWEPVPSDRW